MNFYKKIIGGNLIWWTRINFLYGFLSNFQIISPSKSVTFNSFYSTNREFGIQLPVVPLFSETGTEFNLIQCKILETIKAHVTRCKPNYIKVAP